MLIVEVFPPTTARNDGGDKWLAYRTLPTLREYVLIWQDHTRIEVRAVGKEDAVRVLESPDEVLVLASVGLEMASGEVYG